MMKRRIFTSTLVAIAMIAGCVPSLHPVYTENDLVFEPAIVGLWKQKGSEAKWEFSKHGDLAYRLVFTDKNGRSGRFVAHVAEIDGTRFLDLFPEKGDLDANAFYKFHLMPIHTIYAVKQISPDLEFAAIDMRWLNQHLTDHPDAIQHATYNGQKLITARSEDVQRFLVENKEKFTGRFELERLEK